MGTQQFCLKWNNHQSNMLTVFDQLLSNEALVDVTLACEGFSLKAHKMVLSACSPFFQALFIENPCKHPIVILKDMRYTDLKAIVEFMYRGEVNVSQDQLSALLKTAETLKVKGLAEVTNEKQGPSLATNLNETSQSPGTPQSIPASGSAQQHRAESPPLSKRKRGRPRRRSPSDSNVSDSEDQVPTKIKEPDSPEIIEDGSMEVSNESRQRLAPSSSVQSSQVTSKSNTPKVLPSHTQQDSNITVEEVASGEEADFEVEPSKLMEQSMTTENVPVYPDVPASVPSQLPLTTPLESQSHHTGSTADTQALVPSSLPSDPSVSGTSQQDIKPTSLLQYDEQAISPVASSHQSDSTSSMRMFMDTSGVPAIPGPSNYHPDNQQTTQPSHGTFLLAPNRITLLVATPQPTRKLVQIRSKGNIEAPKPKPRVIDTLWTSKVPTDEDNAATEAFLSIISRNDILKRLSDKNVSKNQLFKIVWTEMVQQGFAVSSSIREGAVRCHQKWRNLKRAYYKYILYNKVSKRKRDPPPFFHKLSELLTHIDSTLPSSD